MARIPDEFSEEFSEKGETFFKIAELLYTQPDRQFTQDELAELVGRSNPTISGHTQEMVDEKWLSRRENQTTFSWDTSSHNPASTEGVTAIRRFYVDFWMLLKKHSSTGPGTFAIYGSFLIIAAGVLFAFFVGVSVGVENSAIPEFSFLLIAVGSFLTGVIVSFLSPLQAVVNRYMLRYLPERLYKDE